MPPHPSAKPGTDLYFVGDTHGETGRVVRQLLRSWPAPGSAVIFLGDLCLTESFNEIVKPLRDAGLFAYWIRGNHDTDSAAHWGHLECAMDVCLDGRITEICGVRIAGLGGVFRKEIWLPGDFVTYDKNHAHSSYEAYLFWLDSKRPPKDRGMLGKQALRHKSSIFPEAYQSLMREKADILIAHEAPGCIPSGFRALDYLADAMEVKKIIFGHHHVTRHYPPSECRQDAYCVGECDYVVLPAGNY